VRAAIVPENQLPRRIRASRSSFRAICR